MSRVRSLAVNAADHLIGKNRLDAAASILENYLSAHPESADILRRLGRIRLLQGNPEIAVPLFERAIAKYGEQDVVPQAVAAKSVRVSGD